MKTPKIENEETIRARAHSLWEAEGRPEGRAEFHWQSAVESLAAPVQAEKPAVKKAPRAKATKAPKAK